MERTLKNEIVFTNLDNKYIIKCECLNILRYAYKYKIYDINLASYLCNKVKIIELYDIDKNIINSIISPRYNNILKIGLIIDLKSFKKNEELKRNIYFKTYIRAFIDKNKIDNIKYNILDTGEITSFENDNIYFRCFMDIFKFKGFDYFTNFYYNKKLTHYIYEDLKHLGITYLTYDKLYNYEIVIYSNEIIITKLQKNKTYDIFHKQIIICDKELNILQILEKNWNKIIYEENRDNNGIIINIKKYDSINDKLEIILSNVKSLLIKSDKKFPQELLDFYNSKIKYDLDKLKRIRDVELYNAKNKLLKKYLLIIK